MDHIRSFNTTSEVTSEIGRRLKGYRLQQNRTLDDLARDTGLGRATVARAEAGKNPSLDSLVRILRALGKLDALDDFLPAPTVSPLQIAESEGKPRRRPRRRRE